MDQRVRFIAALREDPRGNFSRLCEHFGIARSVGYKWVGRYNAHGPNDVWSVDFKGHFATSDGARCHPLTISDNATRFLVKCEALREPKDAPVREQFELAFREFGLPARIRSDNGVPFVIKAVGGLSRLSVWWIQLGIVPERIELAHPEQNGRHERMHKTLKEQTASPPAATFADQQRTFDRFRADYNNDRPHEALGQTPPRAHYEPSLRVMPESLRQPEYGSDVVLRRVQPNGRVGWLGPKLLLSKLLAADCDHRALPVASSLTRTVSDPTGL